MKQIMPFEKFEYIMKQIQEYEAKRGRISDFLEKELCSDSFCLFNVGEDLLTTVTSMLADEFNCWYNIYTGSKVEEVNKSLNEISKGWQELLKNGSIKQESDSPVWWNPKVRRWDNDIEYWLYEDNKRIVINEKEIPIETLPEFYDYLVKYCVDKK